MTSADSTPPAQNPPVQTPAGWYSDPTGEPRMRWWDGTGWTDHVSAPSTLPTTAAPSLRDTVPSSTPATTVFIWILVFLPLVSTLLGLLIDYRSLGIDSLRQAREDGGDAGVHLAQISVVSLLVGLAGWIVVAAIVTLAYFDSRRLRATGFERPFPWPWAFFSLISGVGVLVYVIGRTVVVRRRSGRGLAPLFVAIAVVVVGIVISTIHIGQALGPILDQIGSGQFGTGGSFDSGTLDS